MTHQDTEQNFSELKELKVPVKRAAYSDRTAWIMAVLSELVYTEFDEDSDMKSVNHKILSLAGELALVSDDKAIEAKLHNLKKFLFGSGAHGSQNDSRNEALKAALRVGGFELAGDKVLVDRETDTQGFVVYREAEDGTGMAVICFRGTKEVRDWMTNLKISPVPIKDEETSVIIGSMHEGFHDAYRSLHSEIEHCLKGHEYLPLYITGHSLGGALAVVATWYQSSNRLGACYTFGAPRVCDQALMDKFKTPIYRIVNGPDPVPFIPPSGRTIDFFKIVSRMLAAVFPWGGVLECATKRLIKIQRFRHCGYMRYMTVVDAGESGEYPKLQVQFGISSLGRLSRYWGLKTKGEADRIDKYHDMVRYRDKLRAHARRRN